MRQRPQEVSEPEKPGNEDVRSLIYLWGQDGEVFHGGRYGTSYPSEGDTLTPEAREQEGAQ